jgi:hypothetical protein
MATILTYENRPWFNRSADTDKQYLELLIERQEETFAAWRKSGYTLTVKWEEFLAWQERAMNLKAYMRSCR